MSERQMKASPAVEVGGWIRLLRRDPVAIAGAAAFLFVATFYVFPIVPRETLAEWSGGLFLLPLCLWVAVATLRAGNRVTHPEERRFWYLLGAGFAFWTIAIALTLLPVWERNSSLTRLVYDSLAVLFAICLIVASTESPHLPAGWSRTPGTQGLVYAGAAAFGVGMMAYFDLIPYLLDRTAFSGRLPAYYLFLALDLTLVLSMISLYHRAPNRRWKLLYGALYATAVFILIGDLLDALPRGGLFSYTSGSAWDFVWYAIFPPLALAACLRTSGFEPQAQSTEVRPRIGNPILSFAFLVPIIHFSLSLQDLLGSGLETPRRLTALATMLALLLLLRGQSRRLEVWRQKLAEDLSVARERMQSAERVDAIGRLAGGVAHEFNNKLMVILATLELLELESGVRPELAAPVETIRGAARHMARLTAELLAVGQRQILTSRAMEVGETLTRLAPALREALGPAIRLELVASPQPVIASVDERWLERALELLADNSREAMPAGGRFRIETSTIDESSGSDRSASARRSGRFVIIDVTDDGPGVPADTLGRMFEPFFSTKGAAEGRGLGLAIVRGIAEQSGGFATAESPPAGGFRCRLRFPLAAASPAGPASASRDVARTLRAS